jgi:hypothetical protein
VFDPDKDSLVQRLHDAATHLQRMTDRLDEHADTIEAVDEQLAATAKCHAIDLWSLEMRLEALAERLQKSP